MIENSLLPAPHYADVLAPANPLTSNPTPGIGIQPTSA
jgi:hypothetical protein